MTYSASDHPQPYRDQPRHVVLAERMYRLRRGLTLRVALLSLLSIFSLGLIVLVATNGVSHLSMLQAYRVERDTDLTRQAIRSAFIELETGARWLGYSDIDPARAANAPAALEAAINRMEDARNLSFSRGYAGTVARLDAQIGEAATLLGSLRLESGFSDDGTLSWQGALEGMTAELADLRRDTVGTLHIADVQMALLHLARDQTIAQHRDLDIATDIVVLMLSDPSRLSMEALGRLDAALIRLQMPPAALLAADDAIALPNIAFRSLAETIREGVIPSLEAVARQMTTDPTDPGLIARWIDQVERADAGLRAVLAEADRIALTHIDARIDLARRDAVIASTGGVLVLLAYILSIVMIMRRLITPMTRLRDTLMRLAQGDLRPIDAPDTPFFDVRAVIDALRVFRIDAIRRERLLQERLELTAELTAANREMRADLEAAAALQIAKLPRPGKLGDLRFHSHFRASRHLGGDSFDFFRLQDGRVVMFQIDVAGHGTASSLVAVAAHTAIKRNLLELGNGQSLVDVLEDVNTNWQQELPYFTAVLIAFGPSNGTGTMVQAGHPYPLLLPASGDPERLGEGALPIGVLADPEYREQPVALRPGDRLFVFSDGIYEVKNAEGTLFGEDRLAALIGRSGNLPTDAIIDRIMSDLRAWAGAAELDDDISLVVMERNP